MNTLPLARDKKSVAPTFLLTVMLVALGALECQAQTPASEPPPPPAQADTSFPEFDDGKLTALVFFLENDLMPHFGGNEDRNYTWGFAGQASGSFVRTAKLVAPLSGLDWLSRMKQAHETSTSRYYTLLAFGTGFTPDNLNEAEPLRDDRPYASIVGVTIRRMTVNAKTFDRAWSSELSVGMLGLDIIGDLQTKIHRWNRSRSGKVTPYDPLGWHNQISDGGEPTALYRVSYERRLAGNESGFDVRKHWQLVGGVQPSIGYYTNVALLSSARLGWFNSEFWEFSPGAMRCCNQNLGLGMRRQPRWELFLYGGLRPTAVAYNAMLQGQFRSSTHTVSPRRLVAEWEGGIATFVPFLRTQFIYQFAQGRSPEFDGARRTHTWGSALVVFSWPVKQL